MGAMSGGEKARDEEWVRGGSEGRKGCRGSISSGSWQRIGGTA